MLHKYQCWHHAYCFVFWCNLCHPGFFICDDLVQKFATVNMTCCRNINADSMLFAFSSGVMCATHVSSSAMIWSRNTSLSTWYACRNINAYSNALCFKFWWNVSHPRFFSCDDRVQKLITVNMICYRNISADSMYFALCSGVMSATHVSSPAMIWSRISPLSAWHAAEISMLTPCALLCVLE